MKIRNNNGTAVVEFAVILPLLLLILFGIIEFGFLLYNKAMLTNASREATRIGIVYTLDRTDEDEASRITGTIISTINNYLENNLINFGGDGIKDPIIEPGISSLKSGDNLSITLQYPYNFVIIGSLIPQLNGTFQLEARTTMRAE